MNYRLKNKPLAVQIWIILGLVLGLSFALVTILFPLVMGKSFTHETYARIKDFQDYILNSDNLDSLTENWPRSFLKDNFSKKQNPPPPFREVRHIFLTAEGEIIGNLDRIDRKFMAGIIEEFKIKASNQEVDVKNYVMDIEDKKILYVIRKTEINGRKGFLISYLWAVYRENLVRMTFLRLIETLIFVLIISWIASLYITRYITKPLKKLETRVKEIAARKWDTPVSLNRSDEIGKLGEAIEWMSCQLVEQNEKQQSFLQQISHELKTPIMVIRSYAQSISDGIFPKGTLENSIKVIEKETFSLEKKVGYLLKLTKYDYLSTQKLEKTEFNLSELIKEKIESLRWRRSDLEWDLELGSITINADKEKLVIVLENLLDNQIRYANKVVKIELTVKEQGGTPVDLIIRFWNDGPQIEPDVMKNIFKKFNKGDKGNHGLGLAIVNMIVSMHQGMVWAENEENGVAFYVQLPF